MNLHIFRTSQGTRHSWNNYERPYIPLTHFTIKSDAAATRPPLCAALEKCGNRSKGRCACVWLIYLLVSTQLLKLLIIQAAVNNLLLLLLQMLLLCRSRQHIHLCQLQPHRKQRSLQRSQSGNTSKHSNRKSSNRKGTGRSCG